MKKRLTLLISALICASMLVLPACGGSSGSADGGGTAAEEKADPSAKFVGTWKFAAAQIQGITMTGNIGMFIDGAEDGIILTITEDGKGSLALGEDSTNLTWELTDDETITMTVQKSDDDSTGEIIDESEPVPVKYLDGALSLEMKSDDMTGSMIFTEDGTWAGATMISADSLSDITDSKGLVGEWKLTGVTMQGICMYGSAEDLSSVVPTDTDTTITLNDDGTAKAMGEDMKWSADESGAKLVAGSTELPLKAFEGGIALDMSEFFGAELVMLYSK